MLPVSCYGSNPCRCVGVVPSPSRVLGVGGTFERVDQFEFSIAPVFSAIGTAVKAVAPTLLQGGIGLGFTVLTAKLMGGDARTESTPRQQVATVNQGPLDLAAGEARSESARATENTLNVVIGVAAAAVIASILLSRRRR